MKIFERLFVLNTILLMPSLAVADSLGTHCWQQTPFAHILCFEVNDVNGRYFSLIGENMTENASYPVDGSALFDNNNGVFRLSFTQNLGDTFVFENAVTIDTTLSGTWTDDGGNSGEFQYLGIGPLDPEKIKAILTRTTKKVSRKKRSPK